MRKNIKELRKQRGMTQKQLAELVCTSQSAIANYENGKRQPNMEMALKISIALEVSLDQLWHGTY